MDIIPLSFCEDPEVLEVHEIPSEEVRMVPDLPTVTKVLFPKVTILRKFEVPDDLEVHKIPSEDEKMIPLVPTVTKMLFA